VSVEIIQKITGLDMGTLKSLQASNN